MYGGSRVYEVDIRVGKLLTQNSGYSGPESYHLDHMITLPHQELKPGPTMIAAGVTFDTCNS